MSDIEIEEEDEHELAMRDAHFEIHNFANGFRLENPNLCTNLDDFELYYGHPLIEAWETALQLDNVYPITLCPKKIDGGEGLTVEQIETRKKLEEFMKSYANKKDIHYVLYTEVSPINKNLHYHGVMAFPNEKSRKNFQQWYNKNFGKYHQSEIKEKNIAYWETYCKKSLLKTHYAF